MSDGVAAGDRSVNILSNHLWGQEGSSLQNLQTKSSLLSCCKDYYKHKDARWQQQREGGGVHLPCFFVEHNNCMVRVIKH